MVFIDICGFTNSEGNKIKKAISKAIIKSEKFSEGEAVICVQGMRCSCCCKKEEELDIEKGFGHFRIFFFDVD